MTDSKNIAVAGAGLMGHGIAYLLAHAGHSVRIFDPSSEALASLPARLGAIARLLGHDGSASGRVVAHSAIADITDNVDFVFEAVFENLQLKQTIIAELESLVAADTIIASNTSAIPIAQIASNAAHPERIVGAHFWNPPHLVKLVEVVQAPATSAATIDALITLLNNTGHHAVHVKKDVPGFIGNRLQHALKREAIALVAAGVCDAETLDDVVKYGFGSRMPVLGPLEQSDLVGLDLVRAIQETLLPELDRSSSPQAFLEQQLAAGHKGMSTGQGFRTWTPESAEAVRKRLNDHLVAQHGDMAEQASISKPITNEE